jgi:CheY-like chemotaxis protein
LASVDVLPGSGEGRTPVILLVEDDVLIRFATAEMLRDEGYAVLEAVDATEALALLETGHPLDLVLSDVRMPGDMDGVALTYAMKTLRPNLPMVLVSSHLPPDCQHAGDDFLAKPYGPSQLFELVQKLVGATCNSRRSNPSAS